MEVLGLSGDGRWVVHLGLDVRDKSLVIHTNNLRVAGKPVRLGSTDDTKGDTSADVTDAVDTWVQETVVTLLLSQGSGEGLGGGIDHVLVDQAGLGDDGAHTDTWEDIHVVSLTGFVLLAVLWRGVGWEWRSRSEEDLLVGADHGLLEGTFGLGDWVGEWEDDWAFAEGGHLLDDCLVECASDGGETHENGWLDIVDDFLKALVLLAIVVAAGEDELVFLELVTAVVGDETLRVNEVEQLASLFFRETTLLLEHFHDLAGDTNTGRTSTKEDQSLVLGVYLGLADSVDNTSKNDGTGSLDIVVEASIHVLVLGKRWEGVLEVLELDDDAWPAGLEGNHHLIHEQHHLVLAQARHLGAKVKLIVKESLVVGTQVENDWEGLGWVDTGTGGVQGKLADGDSYASNAQVTESENSGTIGNNGNINLLLWPVVDNISQVAAIGPGQVQSYIAEV